MKEALMVVKTEAAGQNPHKHTQKTSNSMQRGRASTWDRLSTRIVLYRGWKSESDNLYWTLEPKANWTWRVVSLKHWKSCPEKRALPLLIFAVLVWGWSGSDVCEGTAARCLACVMLGGLFFSWKSCSAKSEAWVHRQETWHSPALPQLR